MLVNWFATLRRLVLVTAIQPAVLGASDLYAQSAGCSESVARIVESAFTEDSAAAPLGLLLAQRDRIVSAGSTITQTDICTLALTGALQNHRSGHRDIGAVFERLAPEGSGSADLLYGSATIRNQRGGYFTVLTDAGLARSTDPLVNFEIARALFLVGHADSAMKVMRAVVTSDAGAAALLAHFSYPAFSANTRVEVARAGGHARGTRILNEWSELAWASGLTAAERLAIHFQRTAHADTMYFGVRRPFSDSTEIITSGRAQPDPRREVFIRFGDPSRTIITSNPRAIREDVTWAYADPESKDLVVFHFAGANANYALIQGNCAVDWVSDRATLTPEIGRMYQYCVLKSGDRSVVRRYQLEMRAAYRRNLDREFVVPATLRGRFAYSFYTFGGTRSGVHDVVAVGHVPEAEIPTTGALRAGVFFRGEQGDIHSEVLDHRIAAPGDAMVVIILPDLPAGEYSYRMRMSDRSFKEGFVYGGEHAVQLAGGEDLKLSDLVIARANVTGALQRGTERLQPIVGAISESEFDLYGEAYGIPAGQSVDVQISITRDGGLIHRGTDVSLKFTDTVDEGGYFAFRRLVQHDLEPGKYELTVTLQNATSGMAERSTVIEIQ